MLIRQTQYYGLLILLEEERVSLFIVWADVWHRQKSWSPGLKSLLLSPEVLRLHIFDIEPPSVAVVRKATDVILRYPPVKNIKKSLENPYVSPTQALKNQDRFWQADVRRK